MTKNPEYDAFNKAMKKILSVSKKELKRRLEAEKAAKTASSRVHADKG